MPNLLIFFLLSALLSLLILLVTYLINTPSTDYEKRSAYECGFEPFGDARSFFDIHFYLIGILFIIFDLEIVFLLPFIINIQETSSASYISIIIFILVVLVGFYYEWASNLLS